MLKRKPNLRQVVLNRMRPDLCKQRDRGDSVMKKVILLAATFVLSTGVMVAQSSTTAIDNQKPNATPDQSQRAPQATPPMVPHQPPDTIANPDHAGATPETRLPSTTIDDQQPGNSTGSPSSTMGTTGSTPGTEPSAEPSPEGNKSGTTPNRTQTPETKSTEPHERYQSGSSSPNSPANGASGDDMSGTSPHPESPTNSTNPQTAPPHIATHAPDAGTEMNPAAFEPVAATAEQH